MHCDVALSGSPVVAGIRAKGNFAFLNTFPLGVPPDVTGSVALAKERHPNGQAPMILHQIQ